MGLLATWDKYSTYVDAQGKYRVIWQVDATGEIIFHKFDTFKTEAELIVEFDVILRDQEFGRIKKLQIKLDDNEELIKDVVIQIRTHPALTLSQYNTYLNGKQWYEQVVIRAFIYKLALLLSQDYGIALADYTETEILRKVRNWICNVNINILKKVIFGYFINL